MENKVSFSQHTLLEEPAFLKRKMRIQALIFWVFRGFTVLVGLILVGILSFILVRGVGALSWEFISTEPRNGMKEGGILTPIIGTLVLVLGSMLAAFPIGVASGVYMVEYARDGYFRKFIRLMTNNLAAIPSIVHGLFGLALFVNWMHMGASILAGSLTLALLALPIIIRTTEEALLAVDGSLRTASLAMGATRWQTIRKVVLPVAFPNIITGLILAIGRVAGETAPILFTVAAFFLSGLPRSLNSQVMALPYHLYVLSTNKISQENAYGTAVVLIAMVLLCNLLAGYIRKRYKKS